ncbi:MULTISPECIES: ImmA/IrrE family metallo-endopeptidase [Limosilactobacillus]|nr:MULTISPECIES: ImmA/IrrE family metallo-endopeptidase [Limosilactobacillus]
MMDNIQDIISQLGVVVIVGELDNPGYYNPIWNAIFIAQDLNEVEHEVVLLHELGHAAKQQGEYSLYQATMTMKSKMEYGANRFMIRYLFHHYISITGDDPHLVNYLEFMRQNDIPSRDENIVKEVILNY